MSNVPITDLPTASSLAATDVFPLVQGGVTKQAAFSSLPFLQSGTGASSTRTTQNKLRDVVSVEDFGAIGDGVTNDLAAVTAAFVASRHVAFKGGKNYNLGNLAAGAVAITINGNAGPVSLLTPTGQAKFTVNTTSTGSSPSEIFRIQNAVGVLIGDLAFRDSGYDQSLTIMGAVGLNINASSAAVSDIRISSLYAKSMVAPIILTPFSSSRVSGVSIGLIYADTCTYGFNAQDNGDGVDIGLIYATGVSRSYFVYGCARHRVNIFSTNNYVAASADVLIAAYSIGRSTTSDLDITYHCESPNMTTQLIQLNAFGESTRTIQNIKLSLDIDSSTTAIPVQFRAYSAAGVENTGSTNNVFDQIAVQGRISAASAANYMAIACQPSTKGILVLDDSILPSKLASSITTYFNTGNVWTSFTPSWTSLTESGTATKTARYMIKNRTCFVEYHIVPGASTTATGSTFVALPFTAQGNGAVYISAESAGAVFTGTPFHNTANALMCAWTATGVAIHIFIIYEMA